MSSIKIPGVNFEEGGSQVGIVIDSQISVTLNGTGETYTVPAGKMAKIKMWASTDIPIQIEGSGNTTVGVNHTGEYTLGPNATIQFTGANGPALYIRGTLFTNG